MKINILGKEIKKVLPYFNKVFTDKYKEENGILIEDFYGKLKFSSGTNKFSVSILIDANYKNFISKMYISFNTFKSMFSKIKAKDKVEIIVEEVLKLYINENPIGDFDYIKEPDLNCINNKFLLVNSVSVDRQDLLGLFTGSKCIKEIEGNNYYNNIFLKIDYNELSLLNLNSTYTISNTINIFNLETLKYKTAMDLKIVRKVLYWLDYLKENTIRIALHDDILNIFTENKFFNIKVSDIEKDRIDKCIECIEKIHCNLYDNDNKRLSINEFKKEFKDSTIDNEEGTISTKLINLNSETIKLDLYSYKNLIMNLTDDVKVSIADKSKFRPLIFRINLNDIKVNIILNKIYE